MEQVKRLYRSHYDTVFGGVAAGLGKYFTLDVMIVRLLFVLAAILSFGTGVVVYLILWIAIPLDPDLTFKHSNSPHYFEDMENKDYSNEAHNNEDFESKYPKPKNDGALIAGIAMISVGVLFLISRFIPNIEFGDLWPVLLIIAGLLILKNNFIKPKQK